MLRNGPMGRPVLVLAAVVAAAVGGWAFQATMQPTPVHAQQPAGKDEPTLPIIAAGMVDKNGKEVMKAGVKWKAERMGPGVYRVSFAKELDHTPLVVATGHGGETNHVHVTVTNVTTTHFVVDGRDLEIRQEKDKAPNLYQVHKETGFSFVVVKMPPQGTP